MAYIGIRPAGISSASQVETGQLTVDNVKIDGNTISSTDTNGDITLDPNGTGDTIIASGNLGVGTTSPGGLAEFYKAGTSEVLIGTDNGGTAQLSLYESDDGTKEGLLKYDGLNNRIHLATSGAANALVIPRDSGNVGIGTSSPSGELHVKASSGFAELYVQGSSSTSGAYLFDQGSEAGLWKVDSGYLAFATSNTERLRILSGGNILVGQTSTGSPGQGNDTYGLSLTQSGRVFASANGTYSLGLNRSDSGELTNFSHSGDFKGSINISASAVSYNTTSDHRLKQNVVDMTGAITRVKSLAPKRFDFIADAGNTVDGFLAHEAQTVVPEAVTGTHNEVDSDGNPVYQGIDQSKLVPLLTAALKESITKIEALETENSTQATQIADLVTRVTALENA